MISSLPRPLCKLNRCYSRLFYLVTTFIGGNDRPMIFDWSHTCHRTFPKFSGQVPANTKFWWPPIEFGRNHEEADVPEKLERWRAACDSRSTLRGTSAVSVLPPSVARAKWRRYWPARVPHHHNTSWTPCCCKIYGPYHGAASKRLFAVKRKRLIKTSLHNRVNIGSMFGQDKFIDPLKTILLYRRTDQ